MTMSVYLREGVEKKAAEKIESALKSLPGAEMRGFVSKEKAWSNLMEILGSQARLLEGIAKNPLPASYEVLFRDVSKHHIDPKAIKDKIEKMEGVDEVQYSEQWLERGRGHLHPELAGLILALCFVVPCVYQQYHKADDLCTARRNRNPETGGSYRLVRESPLYD
jgi:cell division protein FtsX